MIVLLNLQIFTINISWDIIKSNSYIVLLWDLEIKFVKMFIIHERIVRNLRDLKIECKRILPIEGSGWETGNSYCKEVRLSCLCVKAHALRMCVCICVCLSCEVSFIIVSFKKIISLKRLGTKIRNFNNMFINVWIMHCVNLYVLRMRLVVN